MSADDKFPALRPVRQTLSYSLVLTIISFFSPSTYAQVNQFGAHYDDWVEVHHLYEPCGIPQGSDELQIPPELRDDLDQDGVLNFQEFEAGTNPRHPDSDLDGTLDHEDELPLNDFFAEKQQLLDELREARISVPDPLLRFSILTPRFRSRDFWQLGPIRGSDSFSEFDLDSNGLPDYWERAHGVFGIVPPREFLNEEGVVQEHIALLDADNDGFTLFQEYLAGTHPDRPDSDFDGVSDAIDCYPLDHRYSKDSDFDGMPDRYERAFIPEFDPFVFDADRDIDQDGWPNLYEFTAGTNPFLSSSDGIYDMPNPSQPGAPRIDSEDFAPLDPRENASPSFTTRAQDFRKDGLLFVENLRLLFWSTNGDFDDDGVADIKDARPNDRWIDADTDKDGIYSFYEDTYYREWSEEAFWRFDSFVPPFDFVLSDFNELDAQLDFDKDGLNNKQEFDAGTYPYDADTDRDGVIDSEDLWPLDFRKARDSDSDGLPDVWEYINQHNPLVADAENDNDQDGLNAYEEFLAGSSEILRDSDGDGLLDGEDLYPIHSHLAVPKRDEQRLRSSDDDEDGVTDYQEFLDRTNPNDHDTDNDGLPDSGDIDSHDNLAAIDFDRDRMPDSFEETYGFDIRFHDHTHDNDYDLLTNEQEFGFHRTTAYRFHENPELRIPPGADGLSPRDPDSDGDGVLDGLDIEPLNPFYRLDTDKDTLPDRWEEQYGLNPLNPFDASSDFDHDSMPAFIEYRLGKNPQDEDSEGDFGYIVIGTSFNDRQKDFDFDGIFDWWEVEYEFNDFDPSDSSLDFDNDGLSNLAEFYLGTNPRKPDSDGNGVNDGKQYQAYVPIDIKLDSDLDGIPDFWEMAMDLNPFDFNDGRSDFDGDGLINSQEYFLQTDIYEGDSDGDGTPDGWDAFPNNPQYANDADNDGLPDEWEQYYQIYGVNNAHEDPDDDGLTNIEEFEAGTNPQDPDSDNDEIPDGQDLWPTDSTRSLDSDGDGLEDRWETLHWLNPHDPYDAHLDQDGDTLSAIQEFQLGTDLLNRDTDRDGIEDYQDAFPTDKNYRFDSDNDGLPDAYEEKFARIAPPGPGYYDDYPSDAEKLIATQDYDADGLSTLDEFLIGSHPFGPDTDDDGSFDGDDLQPLNPRYGEDRDFDGLPDEYEYEIGSMPDYIDSHFDFDEDGLTNLEEYQAGTSPNDFDSDRDGMPDDYDLYPANPRYSKDSDGDTMPDRWEQLNGTDPYDFSDFDRDDDSDELFNLREFLAGTHPHSRSTDLDHIDDAADIAPLDPDYAEDFDRDGLPLRWEVIHHIDALGRDYNNDQDLDGDGLDNYREFLLGTNPREQDTDKDGFFDRDDAFPADNNYRFDWDLDGMPNALEQQYGLDVHNPRDAYGDIDNDGVTNITEFVEGLSIDDPDTDKDGVEDGEDAFPKNPKYHSDSDSDGLPDSYEEFIGSQPDLFDSDQDNDGDLLDNLTEFKRGTNPWEFDTDRDGFPDLHDSFPLTSGWSDFDFNKVPDEWERFYGLLHGFPPGVGIVIFDEDNDGFFDFQEFELGTNPVEEDSDFDGVDDFEDPWPTNPAFAEDGDEDGLPTAWEILNGYDPANPEDAGKDSDADGLTLLQEFTLGTDAELADTDGDGEPDGNDIAPLNPLYTADYDQDGMPNEYEDANGLNAFFAGDAFEDADLDGLSNVEEFKAGTDIQSPDTDGDGIQDLFDRINQADDEDYDGISRARELEVGFDPQRNDHFEDSDGDLISNAAELANGTDPFKFDTDDDGLFDRHDRFPLDSNYQFDEDRDGMPDEWEIANGLDHFNIYDALENPDGDELTNAEEFAGGRDPHVNETRDSDGDGVPDVDDEFPYDPSESADSDGDGVGDNADAFPNDPAETSDADGDGVGDNSDVFPHDPNESADSDGDGIGDNSDDFPNDPSLGGPREPSWNLNLGERVLGTPVNHHDGTLLVATADGNLLGVDDAGQIDWFEPLEFPITEQVYWEGGDETIAYLAVDHYDGSIYYLSDKTLVALNADRTLNWTYEFDAAEVPRVPVIGPDGTLYMASSSINVTSISHKGEFRWNKTLPILDGFLRSPKLTVADSGTLYVTGNNERLFAIAPNGEELWSYVVSDMPHGQQMVSPPAVGPDGTIHFGVFGDKGIFAINPDGSLKWNAGPWQGPEVQSLHDVYHRIHVDSEGNLYFSGTLYRPGSSLSFGIFSLDSAGDIRWHHPIETISSSILTHHELNDGVAFYYIDRESSLVALDLDGKTLWSRFIGDEFNKAPHLTKSGLVVFKSSDNSIAAIESQSYPVDLSTDSDGDGVADLTDQFPNDPNESRDSDRDGVGDNADAFPFDDSEQVDTDGDGVGDNGDAFPNDPAETADSDGDGVGDNADAFPNDPTETADSDGDGVGDNSDLFPSDPSESADSDGDGVGDNADAFPADPSETADSDGDGVGDNSDVFPNDPAETVDSDGDGVGDNGDAFPADPSETADSDGDGVGDNSDAFPNDPAETVDSDGDGVGDNGDAFPADPSETTDSDGDGVGDNSDAFPNDPAETVDSDGDGVGDNGDAFPSDPSETADTDGDGVGDNGDAFPTDPSESADSDGDGVGDNSDAFPADPSESVDSDGDGVGDNSDAFPADPSESVDSDGDGVGDNSDAFPNDPAESADSDGDGVGDNADAFPNDPAETTDTDGDGVGNVADEDDDGDTMPDAWELEFGFDPLNAADALADADGDGFTNAEEFANGTDPLVVDGGILFEDQFERADDAALGGDWLETEVGGTELAISDGALLFNKTSDVAFSPIASAPFVSISSGKLTATWQFNWKRARSEGDYRVFMQLGDESLMTEDNFDSGTAVNLVWTKIGGVHEAIGYRESGSTQATGAVATGIRYFEVVVDLELMTYDVKINGAAVASDLPFTDSNVGSVNSVRFFTDKLNHYNFSGRSFDDVVIQTGETESEYLLLDNFDRIDNDELEFGWQEFEVANGRAEIDDSSLYFVDTSDLSLLPMVQRNFAAVSSGEITAAFDFDWTRSGNEGGYELFMQLGDSGEFASNHKSNGAAVNLIWSKINGVHETLGYMAGSSKNAIDQVSGTARIEISINLDTQTYSVAIDGNIALIDIPFDQAVSQIDSIRFFTNGLNEVNFSGRRFDSLQIQ